MNDRARKHGTLEVRYRFTGEVVGTVSRASVDDVRRAFAAARACKPVLTRLERATIMLAGNKRQGALYSPTVIDQVRPDMTVVKQETFSLPT